jgi:hypothetical protein
MMAFEQIESVWPVHGSVLIQDDVLYCVAGRSMFVDGGLRLWRLDPQTGRVLSETVMDDSDPAGGKDLQDYVSWLNMPTAMPDILSSDGRLVYMRGQPFRLDGQRLPLEAMPTTDDIDRARRRPSMIRSWLTCSRRPASWTTAAGTAPTGCTAADSSAAGQGISWPARRRRPDASWSSTTSGYTDSAASRSISAGPRRSSIICSPRKNTARRRRRSPSHGARDAGARRRSPSLNPRDKPLAVAAWVRADKPDGVVLARGGSLHGYALFFQGGKPHFAIRSDGELVQAAAEHRAVGRWVHLAGVLTADQQVQLYVDGKLVATVKSPGWIIADPNDAMEIGADDGSTVGSYLEPSAFDGAIDEVRIFHGTVTADEIAQLARDTLAPRRSRTPSWCLSYSFDDGQAQDASGHGNHGTVEGAEATEGKFGRALKFVGGPSRVRGYDVPLYWTEDLPLWARALVLADECCSSPGRRIWSTKRTPSAGFICLRCKSSWPSRQPLSPDSEAA